MGFLTEAERGQLRIESMILHVVGEDMMLMDGELIPSRTVQ